MSLKADKLKKLRRELDGMYGKAADELNTSRATISRLLNARTEDNELLEKLVNFRDREYRNKYEKQHEILSRI